MNDDMDDLFRKAAEQYPLKTDAGNFDAVQKQLQQEDVAASISVANKRRFDKRWLLLLLLLPLPFICTRFGNAPVDTTAVVQVEKHEPASTQAEVSKNKKDAVIGKANSDVVTGTTDALKTKNFTTKDTAAAKVVMNKKALPKDSNAKVKLLTAKQSAQYNTALQSAATTMQHQQQPLKKEASTNSNAVINKADSSISKTEITTSTKVSNADSTSVVADNKKTVAKKTVVKKASTQTGFYAGVMAGIDASTIKYQAIKDKGFNLGLLAGYQFNKSWSVETGVYWDRKKYYSEGKYFDKTRSGIASNVYVVYLDGYCNMFEVPANVKFNFLQTANGNFFATTGVSTYIMKKEKYNYLGSVNGWDYEGTHQYKNATTNWFGVMNLSAGFQHKFFNRTNFRTEAYYKLPLSGLGIGRMSITSFGFNIGITHPLK